MWQTVGFDRQKIFFETLIKEKPGFSRAFLFSGPAMIGKRTLALELAGKLSGCSGDLANNPDHWFKGEEEFAIAEARDLKKFLSFKSYGGGWRTVVLDEVENWRGETANALLKILEEPPAGVLFFLMTAAPTAVLPTIVSRCLEIRFAPHSPETVQFFLQNQGFNQPQADFLTHFINGQIGMAVRWQRQGVLRNLKEKLSEFNRLVQAPIHERLSWAEKFVNQPTLSLEVLLCLWMFYLRSPFSKNLKIRRPFILRNLLEASRLWRQSQYNRRLIVENLLLGF